MADDDETWDIKHSTENTNVQVATCGEPLPSDPRTPALQALAQAPFPGSIVFLFRERAGVYMPLPGQENVDTVKVQPVVMIAHPRAPDMLGAALRTMRLCRCGHPLADHLTPGSECAAPVLGDYCPCHVFRLVDVEPEGV